MLKVLELEPADKRFEWEYEYDFYDEKNYDTDIHSDIMQYTGLKDKNGVEIYEGDILSGANGSINHRPNKITPYAVKFENGKYDMHLFMFPNDMDNTHFIEVIGNIHENPELVAELQNAKT